MIAKSLGKLVFEKCGMCDNSSKANFYLWIGDITKSKLSICKKCAIRELGTRTGKKRLEAIDAMFDRT